MRIGITTHNYPPHLGGLEAIVRELARRFARNHEVLVVSTAWQGQHGVSREDGATIVRLAASHATERMGVPYATPLGPGVAHAATMLRECDVINAHGSLYATTLLGLAARRRETPMFVTEHVGFVEYSSTIVNSLERAAWSVIGTPIVRRARKVIAYNSRVRAWLAARFGEANVEFISNGIDTDLFQPASEAARRAARMRFGLAQDAVLALFVGRAAQKKNLDAVLAFPGRDYSLVVCGASRTLPPDVINLGALPHGDMPQVFAAADFLVHAAIGEGFPVTVQEAMASGLPVALLWDDGYLGSVDRDVVIAVDTLDELGRAAEELALSRERREETGRRARAFALARWNWDETIDRYLTLFKSALGTHS